MNRTFLSYDCANKSLAWSHVTINCDVIDKLYVCGMELAPLTHNVGENIESIKVIIDTMLEISGDFIQFHSKGVINLLKEQNTNNVDEITRTRYLHDWLINSNIAPHTLCPECEVLVEQQPTRIGLRTNTKSTVVQHQLLFYYIDFKLNLVNPRLKNKITVRDDMALAVYVADMKTRRKNPLYAARKKHSADTFIYIMDVFDLQHVYSTVPKPNIDDLADSFMQILGFAF